jgi:transcriptional regulator with XRE-family HTH domain
MTGSLDRAIESMRLRRRLPEPELRRLIRVRAGVPQADLAAELGVNRASISRYENGRREPYGPVLRAYIEALDRLMLEG